MGVGTSMLKKGEQETNRTKRIAARLTVMSGKGVFLKKKNATLVFQKEKKDDLPIFVGERG